MNESLHQLIGELEKGQPLLTGKKVTAGFDGFVDTVLRVIKEKKEDKEIVHFTTIGQFGQYIIDKGSSFSLEVEGLSSRIGGNMPILSNAMAHLGMRVNCVGALGYPVAHPVFANLSANCRVYSFAEPGTSTAYEFEDGKILLGNNGELNIAGWQVIKEKIGIEKLLSLYSNSDLLCFLNWSEIDASTDTWKGILSDLLPRTGKKLPAFFDLSDCSKRSKDAILEALQLLREFSKYCNVSLGLNHNESKLIYQALFNETPPQQFMHIGEKLFDKLGIGKLILHAATEAIGFDANGKISVASFTISNPVIFTGAGDNFNAGFCTAQLLGLNMELSLLTANAVAASYISSGKPSDIGTLIKFIQHAGKL